MVGNSDAALEYVKKYGPVQPSQVATSINTNILFASAILSELVAKKKVKITYLKRGGSPFYYVEGQEEKLMDLAEHLSGKLKESYNLISEKQVIRDSEALPWQRVALRDLKDFAVGVTVNYGGKQELFWKWYLTSNEEAKRLIKEAITVKKEDGELSKNESLEESTEKQIERQEDIVKQDEVDKVESEKPKVVQEKLIEKTEKNNVQEDFFETIMNFFKQNDIYVISQSIVRKGREFNFVVDVPSSLGKLRYFVKFKNKKKIGDSDFLAAIEEANKQKLPVLFLGNGELNKKAQKYLDENVSGQLVFKGI